MIDLGPPPLVFPKPAISRPAADLLRPEKAHWQINNLGGIAGGLKPLPYSVGEVGSPQGATDTSGTTFGFTDNGDEGTNRVYVTNVSCRDTSGGLSETLQNITIGGINATILKQRTSSGSGFSSTVGVAVALVPTGTNVNVYAEVQSGRIISGWLVTLLKAPGIDVAGEATAEGANSVNITNSADTKFVTVVGCHKISSMTGGTLNTGAGTRTTLFAGSYGIHGYATDPGSGATTYDFSVNTEDTIAVSFKL